MEELDDDGYISDYLTHWTGKDGDESGADILRKIMAQRRLRLSYNPLHRFHLTKKIV